MQPKHKKQSTRELRVHLMPQRFEVRSNADGTRSISGYAGVFNSLSEDLGGFKETIKPGAFKQSLVDNPDVLCLYGHDQNQILGRVSSGTMTIGEDNIGLRFTCKLPDTSTARDLTALMERGDISQMSFGFSVPPNGDEWTQVNDQIIRTLINVVLYEVSVVGVPAYSSSSVNLRSCPVALRSKLTRSNDDEEDNTDDALDCDGIDADNPDDCKGCECGCAECRDGNCEQCSATDCDDEDCADCPMQTRAAHTRLLLARLR